MEDLTSVAVNKNKMQDPPIAKFVDQTEARLQHSYRIIKNYFNKGIKEPLTLNMYGNEKSIDHIRELFEKNGFTVNIQKHIVRIE